MKIARYTSVWNGRTMEIEYRMTPDNNEPVNDRHWSKDPVIVQLVDTTLPQSYQQACDNGTTDFFLDKIVTCEDAGKEIAKKLKYPKWLAHAYFDGMNVPDFHYADFQYKPNAYKAVEIPRMLKFLAEN